ncbi:hypothetical protein NW765_017786 [Fusarium oxysporum]|nr:hypothetical protein NW765_017786 [Fusarium oxysporum]KAJ4241676.1 hypothetical protein NW764_016648 [Fusarium oxysporum]
MASVQTKTSARHMPIRAMREATISRQSDPSFERIQWLSSWMFGRDDSPVNIIFCVLSTLALGRSNLIQSIRSSQRRSDPLTWLEYILANLGWVNVQSITSSLMLLSLLTAEYSSFG